MLIALVLSAPAQVAAENIGTINNAELSGILKGVQFKIDDQAKGRCWTNLKTTTKRVRELLESEGLKVYDTPILPSPYTATIELAVVGERDATTKLCYGSRTIRVWAHNFGEYLLQNGDTVSVINQVPVYESGDILLNNFNFNRLMLKFVDESMGGFTELRAKAQESSEIVARVMSEYPDDKVLLSWEEFDTFSESPTEDSIRKNFNADAVYIKHLEDNRF